MVPTVGRIVHYYSDSAFGDNSRGPYAAIVETVIGGPQNRLHLVLFMAGGAHPARDIPFKGDIPQGTYWEWPPIAPGR